MRRLAVIATLIIGLVGCGAPVPIAALPVAEANIGADGIVRHDLRFPCGDTMCAGWLYMPKDTTDAGVVVMGHGFGGTRDVGLPLFAESFAREGMAAFVFDYRHFGASGGAPRQLVDPWQQLDDWKAAIDFMRARDNVDGKRIALWGTSLGGGLALVAATRDGHVRAVVAQAPQIDSDAEGEATFPGVWWATRLLFSGWFDLACSAFTDEPHMISAIARHDSFGMIVDDAAFTAFEQVVPADTVYRNAVAARSVFTFDDYNPKLQAAAITAPVLLIASRDDRFAPYAAVEAFAKQHANVILSPIDGDHFDVYKRPRGQIAADLATTFLARHLIDTSDPGIGGQ